MNKQELIEMNEKIVHNDNVLNGHIIGIICASLLILIGMGLLIYEVNEYCGIWEKIGVAILTIGIIVGIVFWSIYIHKLDLDLRHLKAVYDIEKRI